ncbi:hypothetical protein HMN09_00385100 [Mycena chlorophos]|uniref:Uncharacterized protein n=1 Tax=Mycena chlorophos TaxID=658473 RepID=A0A8H6WNF4_MYCCL|nr:hypothetical protein HMN09_00385100 [Mycena chlorophos]
MLVALAVLAASALTTYASPSSRAATPDNNNFVSVKSKTDFWCAIRVLYSPVLVLTQVPSPNSMIMPKDAHTNIGDSERPGGTTTYCSPAAHNSSTAQGTFSDAFWTRVEYESGVGRGGQKFAQLTGCINPRTVDRLNPGDEGGQYDSSGGQRGTGNPVGSTCVGFKHYVEIVEPGGNRACIRCCNDAADCPTNKDTQGCPVVIPGNYAGCD